MCSLPQGLLALTAILLSACSAPAEAGGAAGEEGRPYIEHLERTFAMGQPGDPVEAADAAIRRGDYRLYWGQAMLSAGPIGVTCHGPTYYDMRGPTAEGLIKGVVTYSDVVGTDETRFETTATDYASAYNSRILVAAGYPYPDVCRRPRPDDRSGGSYPAHWAVPAGPAGPVRSLADAARVGARREVTRFLEAPGVDVDQIDPFGMTPLAWAVVRGQDATARQLLAAGASPLGDDERGRGQAPLLYAVAFKRQALFRTMYASLSRETIEELREESYVIAAVLAGDTETLERFLPPGPMAPRAAALQIRSALYRQHYSVADLLLSRAEPKVSPDALLEVAAATGDLKFLDRALKAGAHPSGGSGPIESPPLYELAGSPSFATAPEMARRLIRAGAEVDKPAHGGETALQVFVRRGTYPPVYPQWAEPKLPPIAPAARTELLRALIAGGADVNRASHGVPMVLQVLHVGAGQPRPRSYDPDWLRVLAQGGMDVNARFENRTALDYARAAGDTELAALLRELGAR